MIPVSVVVMTRNEAANLPHCLSALGRFAERFVVDSGSTDGTPAIAEAAGARVVPFRWDGRYPKKKQWCLDQRWSRRSDNDRQSHLASAVACVAAALPL